MHKKKLIMISNTSFGRPGNIGYRLNKIVENKNDYDVTIFARYAKNKNLNINAYVIFSRFLSLLKKRFFIKKNVRFYDEVVFEFLFLCIMPVRYIFKSNSKPMVAHVSGFYPSIMKYFQKNNIKTVLDIAILPNLCIKLLDNKYSEAYLNQPEIQIENREKICLELADKIICPSKFVYANINAMFPQYSSKMKIIPFGTDFSDKKMLKEDRKLTKNILFAGSLNARKGVDQLVHSFLEINDESAELYLCGREFWSTKLPINPKIRKPGFVDVSEYLSKCGIFVLPTFMEGSAKVVYEAMAAGLAIITTPSAGSIIQNGYDGIIVPAGDNKALTEAMRLVLYDAKLRETLGRRAKLSVRKYTWDRYAEKVYYVLDTVIHRA